MSAAGFLEKLLDGAEVEWVPLDKVVETVTAPSKAKKNDYREQGRSPIVDQGAAFIAGYADDSFEPVACDEYVIFGDHSEHIKYVDFAFVQGADGLKILKPKTDYPKYIYYALMNFYKKTGNYKRHWSQAKETLIPIPCPNDPERSLAIQGEIVRILDTFTEHTAELTAELTQRNKQYNHYRDHLLTFEEDEAGWKALEEVAHFQNAKPHEKLVSPDGDVALLTAGFISSEGKSARFVKAADVLTPALRGDVAMVMSDLPNGRALAKTFFVDENDRYAANQRVCLLRVREPTIFSPKFLHYMMNRNQQLLRYDSGYDQTHLKKDWILEVKVPVPPIAEQARIVAILDTFDTLTASLTEGLPREIELREKQYAYYRDQLLSFHKPDAEAA